MSQVLQAGFGNDTYEAVTGAGRSRILPRAPELPASRARAASPSADAGGSTDGLPGPFMSTHDGAVPAAAGIGGEQLADGARGSNHRKR